MINSEERPSLIVAITGASGSLLGLNLLKALGNLSYFTYLIISNWGFRVMREEQGMFQGIDLNPVGISDSMVLNGHVKDEISRRFKLNGEDFTCLGEMFLDAKISSGSARNIIGMAIAPCSMGTLSRIACGNSRNLIERAADVMLKEKRKLVVCPRETPLNDIHLKNMLSLSRSGAVILPPVPGFYSRPKTIEDMMDFLTGKILDSMGIENNLYLRWEGHE